MLRQRRCQWIVLGDGLLDLPEREARRVVRAFKNALIRALRLAGRPPFILEVVEASGGYHANIICPDYAGIERLRLSPVYGFTLVGKDAIQRVTDWWGLRRYLSEERTSQADKAHGHALGPRKKGPHRLETKKSGDRVRVSDALKETMRQAGVWQDYKRSYAKPLPVPVIEAAQPVAVEEPSGQMSFAPALGEIDDLMTKADAKRRALGIRQEEASDRMHLARSTFANIIARRYRPSPWAMARAAEFLRAA